MAFDLLLWCLQFSALRLKWGFTEAMFSPLISIFLFVTSRQLGFTFIGVLIANREVVKVGLRVALLGTVLLSVVFELDLLLGLLGLLDLAVDLNV